MLGGAIPTLELLGALATRTDSAIVAEGVEHQGELRRLLQMEVPLAQGYLRAASRPRIRSARPGGRPETSRNSTAEPSRAPVQLERSQRFRYGFGSIGLPDDQPRDHISKCRWQAVERPVVPTLPSSSPADTRAPSRTLAGFERCM